MTRPQTDVMIDSGTPEQKLRVGALARLPLFFSLAGKRALLAGNGPGLVWKAELLSASGANVDVYTLEADDQLTQLELGPPHGHIRIHRRGWQPGDFDTAAIAIGSFEQDKDAAAFAAAAREYSVPVNVIDKPSLCDFAFGSIVNRSPLVIGISTDGAAPVFAQAIRARLEALLPRGFARWAQAASRWRAAVKASGLSLAGRREVWHLFTTHAMSHPDDAPQDTDVDRFIDQARGRGPKAESGWAVLVGAGPGDLGFMTLRAVQALQTADAILFDDLVSKEALELARREARKIPVGNAADGSPCKPADINALILDLAKPGRQVVWLVGGDVLNRAGVDEVIAACSKARISVEVVPGITPAQGAQAVSVPCSPGAAPNGAH